MAEMKSSWDMPFSMRQTGWGTDPETGHPTVELAVKLRYWHPRLWWWVIHSMGRRLT